MRKSLQKPLLVAYICYFSFAHYTLVVFLLWYLYLFVDFFLPGVRIISELALLCCYGLTLWFTYIPTRLIAREAYGLDINHFVRRPTRYTVLLTLLAVAAVARIYTVFTNIPRPAEDLYKSTISLVVYGAFILIGIFYFPNKMRRIADNDEDFFEPVVPRAKEIVHLPDDAKAVALIQKFPSVIATGDKYYAQREISYGAARWLSDDEKNNVSAYDLSKPTQEIEHKYNGLWIGGGFFHDGEGNLCSIAPPGTGKGAALIIPNLLWKRNYKHSFVVFDPKGTNACITARFQKEQGKKVVIIDPMDSQKLNNARHGISPSSFNAFDFIKDDVFNGAMQIANLLIPDDNKSEKYWNQDARNLLQLIMIYIVKSSDIPDEEKNLIKLYKFMVVGNFKQLFADILTCLDLDKDDIDIASGYMELFTTSEKQFGSIRSIASAALQWLGNPAIQKCIKHSDFRPDELEKGNVALYLCQPIQNKEGFASLSRLIIGFCLRANSKPSAEPKAWVYYLLDEFPTMGTFPEVIEALAYSREYRMRLWLFAPSLSMLDTVYTIDGRNTIIGSARVFQVFGATDKVTQDYISHRIGNTTAETLTKTEARGETVSFGSNTGWSSGMTGNQSSSSSSSGDNESRGSSITVSQNMVYHSRPLLPPEAVQHDPNIITIADWGPMRLPKYQYWQHYDTKDETVILYQNIFRNGRADANPNFLEQRLDHGNDYYVEGA